MQHLNRYCCFYNLPELLEKNPGAWSATATQWEPGVCPQSENFECNCISSTKECDPRFWRVGRPSSQRLQ